MAASATRPIAEPPPAAGGRPLHVAVAASGGRDSTALLHCTARAAARLGLQVHALHVHHGLMPEADAWQAHLHAQVRRWARSGLPVQLHATALAGPPPAGASVEAWARRERYAALAAMARAAGCDTVLLAHHRRDQAETVLLQLLRGGGPQGLAAMPQQAQRQGLTWLRPWLDQPREAVEAYLRRHRLRWIDDRSNAEPQWARSRLRAQVWGPLTAAFGDVEQALCAAAHRAAEAADCLHELAVMDAAVAVRAADADLDVAAWGRLSPPRRANLLRHWVAQQTSRGCPESLLQRLLVELPQASGARWPAPGGELRHYRGWLEYRAESSARRGSPSTALRGALDRLGNEPEQGGETPAIPSLDLSRPGRHPLPDGLGDLLVSAVHSGGVAADRLRDLRLAPRGGGERFQRARGSTPRSLKKQFQQAGVPAWARDRPLVLAADGSLLYVAGLGLDARQLAPPGVPQCAIDWLPAGDEPRLD